MSQKSLIKVYQDINYLQKELEVLRSFIIGFLGRDKEGKYKPIFIEKILREVKQKAPFTFNNKESFLKKIQS